METSEELSALDGYAAWASCYDEDGNPLVALEGPVVQGWFGPIAGCWALDLGCGTGRHTLALVEAGAQVAAVDQSSEMLARARGKLSGQPVCWVRQSFPGALPFRGRSFDLAVMGLVAEHIGDLTSTLIELARVLREGGRCILSALHPDRTAEGQRARFIDPATGLRRPIATVHRSVEDYLACADHAGFRLIEEKTLVVPPELALDYPRAERYVGLALGWVACWAV
jgi:SAM-dependent methyltransferase